MPVKW